MQTGRVRFGTSGAMEYTGKPLLSAFGNLQNVRLSGDFMPEFSWWIRQVGLTLLGFCFLLLGVNVLMAAYDQSDPFTFILTFFASNLIILISAVLVIGFVCRMVRTYRQFSQEDVEK